MRFYRRHEGGECGNDSGMPSSCASDAIHASAEI
jgi:hypothetical protein